MAHVVGTIEPEKAGQALSEGDGNRRVQVSPGVAFIAKMPEAETEIDNVESNMQGVEDGVEAMTDRWDRENEDAYEDGKSRCTGVLCDVSVSTDQAGKDAYEEGHDSPQSSPCSTASAMLSALRPSAAQR